MESSTFIFIITLIIAFIFLRWLITPIPPSLPNEFQNLANSRNRNATTTLSSTNNNETTGDNSENNTQNNNNNSNGRSRREVTDSMIEIVQAIAPQLTVNQIRYDLQNTGSVELTIERFMESGSLPFPPGEQSNSPNNNTSVEENHNVVPDESKLETNLIEKYNLNDKLKDINENSETIESISENKWSSSKEERLNLLNKKREEMILKARKRLASQLQNEL